MDVTNLARNLYITSANSPKGVLNAVQCFELAENFKQVEENVYPPEAL